MVSTGTEWNHKDRMVSTGITGRNHTRTEWYNMEGYQSEIEWYYKEVTIR
jgi:hypothetical protein